MKTTKSISTLTGLFTAFLAFSAINHIDSIYIPLKQNIAEGNYSSVIILGIELLAFIAIGCSVIKLIKNINKKKFFDKQNHICFYIMGGSLYLPVIAFAIICRILGKEGIEIDHGIYLCGGTFLFILAEIFRYGYHLKEEQELTI